MRRVLGILLALLVLVPSSAAAHSDVVEMDPVDGASLETLPAEATLTFNESPKTANVVLESPDGKIHKLKAQVVGSTVTALLPTAAARGTYTLSYRVVSADGHPISGSSSFTVATGSAPAEATPQRSPEPAAPTPSTEPGSGPSIPIVLGVALLAVAAAVVAARSLRR